MNSSKPINIRKARPEDIPRVQEIYAYHVLNGTASWEYQAPTVPEMLKRFTAICADGFPYLVACEGEIICAYAYVNHFRTRAGYRFCVEDTIYVDNAYLRRGIGKVLLKALLQEVGPTGRKHIIAVIGDSQNTGSIKLHESLGFVTRGILPGIGFKNDQCLDSILMLKTL